MYLGQGHGGPKELTLRHGFLSRSQQPWLARGWFLEREQVSVVERFDYGRDWQVQCNNSPSERNWFTNQQAHQGYHQRKNLSWLSRLVQSQHNCGNGLNLTWHNQGNGCNLTCWPKLQSQPDGCPSFKRSTWTAISAQLYGWCKSNSTQFNGSLLHCDHNSNFNTCTRMHKSKINPVLLGTWANVSGWITLVVQSQSRAISRSIWYVQLAIKLYEARFTLGKLWNRISHWTSICLTLAGTALFVSLSNAQLQNIIWLIGSGYTEMRRFECSSYEEIWQRVDYEKRWLLGVSTMQRKRGRTWHPMFWGASPSAENEPFNQKLSGARRKIGCGWLRALVCKVWLPGHERKKERCGQKRRDYF